MLNIFPVQFLAPFAYAVMRVVVGYILLRIAHRMIKNRAILAPSFTFRFFPYGNFFVWYAGVIEIILAVMLIIGVYTQIATLGLMILSLKFIVMHRRFSHPLLPRRLSYILLFVCAFSLFITGAGALALDLPI